MKRILINIYYIIVLFLPGIFAELFIRIRHKNIISLKCYLDTRWGFFHKQNWGDDMNLYLADLWFDKKIINYATSVISWFLFKENFSLIGSVLQAANEHTIVWGSGLLYEHLYPQKQPKKILAVRGPFSRNVLLKHGLQCPEVYGDPILLLPKYYVPQVEKKYKIGVIPHIHDENNTILTAYTSQNKDVHIISMGHYEHWQDVVNDIVSCDIILSSSLHGLIISDAYNISNVWIEFESQTEEKKFKFYDYFASVKRGTKEPVIVNSIGDIQTATEKVVDFTPIDIDLEPLIKSCPFKLPFIK